MFEDVVADFWKDKLVHLMHRNMVRVNGEKLAIENVKKEFDEFSARYPDLQAIENISTSYATWEINITDEIKLRLFIQGAVKVTLLQKKGSDYVKIADARFPNNPFPEIYTFLEMREDYIKLLGEEKKQAMQNSRKMKIAKQFIIALLSKKFEGSGTIWELEENNQNFNLKLTNSIDSKEFTLGCYDFADVINKIDL